ncbi:MAG: N-acetyl-gamma-glutamyl-phosphate reductase [Clostridiales bacterium]
MIKASILGASGYAGGELLRFLLAHPQVELAHLTGVSSAGKKIGEIFPYLAGFLDKTIEPLNMEEVAQDSDVIFMAMPHGQGVAPAMAGLAKGKKIIDIGADFRFRDALVYEKWYKVKHENHALTKNAVYGLPEIYRQEIKKAQIVGNPGCYPTASLLALYPLLKENLVEQGTIIIDAKSGVSGAGYKPTTTNAFCSADESLKAYNVALHRHTPEIEQVLTDIGGMEQIINFTPHLVPMSRGILATAYAGIKSKTSGQELTDLYHDYYDQELFVHVHDHGNWPQTKWATGSNNCHIALTYDERTGRAIITSVIDNLVKGAAGQAVQNMNLLFDFPEEMALPRTPIFP